MTVEELLKRAAEGPVYLDLGCGEQKRGASWIGIDIRPMEGVDVVGDVVAVLRQLPESCVERVSSSHFLEHVDDLRGLLSEIERILRPGRMADIAVPHFSNAYFYSDYTHRQTFGLYTMSYLAEDLLHRRRVPQYDPLGLRILSVRLVFKSPRPFVGRYAIRRVVEYVVNSSVFAKEFYEENLTGIVSCYEIVWTLQKGRSVCE